MTGALSLACSIVAMLLALVSVTGTFRGSPAAWPLLTFSNALALVPDLLAPFYPLAALNAVLALITAWLWWHNRKKRGRARAALSGKYRHVRDAMVRTLRDRRVPRPVLAPGGA